MNNHKSSKNALKGKKRDRKQMIQAIENDSRRGKVLAYH